MSSIDRGAWLRALSISIPIALAMHFSNYAVWIIVGFPPGVVPQRAELSLVAIVLERLTGVLNYACYLLYGGLYAWFAWERGTRLSPRQAALGGALTGLIPAGITRLIQFISSRPDAAELLAQVQAASPTYPEERARIVGTLGAICGISLYITISVLLSAGGATIFARATERRKAKKRG
jgi:hypothetical protein